ncbi:MAG: NAD-dependent deacetylase [Planctomycetota bacterium]
MSLDALADVFRALRSRYLVAITGAGVSLASGIPTFRGSDPGAVWANDVMEMGTLRFFRRDPVESWRWYLHRFSKTLDARPNPAHEALARLERWQEREGRFLLVTQNIDTLHAQAGSRALVEVHGRADRVRCPAPGCEHGAPRGSLPRADLDLAPFLADPDEAHLPRCPACGDVLRQHVLWFDEYYQSHEDYQWERVLHASEHADLLLLVGTSCSVGVTELFLRAAQLRRIPVVLVDPGEAPDLPMLQVQAPAEAFLPALVDALEEQG